MFAVTRCTHRTTGAFDAVFDTGLAVQGHHGKIVETA
jgi:hypothetical protein